MDTSEYMPMFLAEAVRPGGFLVIGSTERVSNPAGLGLSLQHPFIYRKA